ncbi:MAG: MBL fold metallo-hydrolase [Clostridia bacterium]|nr:MBL fold metallo-hydrolase [Clostridia bacterium]
MIEDGIRVLGHASIRLEKERKVIYIDPYKVEERHDADVIFCTHPHYDHFSETDILRLKKDSTKLVVVRESYEDALKMGFNEEDVVVAEIGKNGEVAEISFSVIPSYNVMKPFHPKGKQWVGYLLTLDGIRYYIAGDTDKIPEMESISCDVAFLPVGGTYTMNAQNAAEAANLIKPKIAIPIHFGSIVGTRKDAEEFVKNLETGIIGKIFD